MIKILLLANGKSVGFSRFGKMEEFRSLKEVYEKRSNSEKKN